MEQTFANNLVQYDDPVLWENKPETIKKRHSTPVTHKRLSILRVIGPGTHLKAGEIPTKADIDVFLNVIFPPLEYENEEGTLYQQKVSSIPPTLDDVKRLETELNLRLSARFARMEGFCNIRRGIFEQAFDELIRQETIVRPERGLLLLKIKHELKMTCDVFKALYDSTVTYATRKSVLLESASFLADKTIQENEPVLVELRKRHRIMSEKVEQAGAKAAEQSEADRKRRAEEVEYHKTCGAHMKAQLEKILAPSDKEPKR